MDRKDTIEKILALAAGSPLRHMFEQMPWWNNWDQLSDPGLQKVLETLEWDRSEIEGMVREVVSTNPDARQEAYAYVRHSQMVDIQSEESSDAAQGGWNSDKLLSSI